MVTIKKCMEAGRSALLYIRCKRAIKRADRQAVVTGKKQLVIMYGKKPLVMSKQHLKKLIREGAFVKGFTPDKAEQMAIYITR